MAVDLPTVPQMTLERCVRLRPTAFFAWISRWWPERIFGWVSNLACVPSRPLGEFSVHIYEKSGTSSLENILVRMDSVAKVGGNFVPDRDLSFAFNSQDNAQLFSSEGAALRRVLPNQQATVRGTIKNLDSGEYAMTLRFVASNADNEGGKVGLSVLVKDAPWIPLLVIVLGVLTSFFTKKLFAVSKDRLSLKARISQLDSAWLRSEPSASAVVWAQANLRLARSLARRAWLTIPDLVSTRLADIEALLPTLHAIRDTRKLLESRVGNSLALTRALGKLAQQTARCSDPPLALAVVQQIAVDLAAMESWAASDSLASALWKDRVASIKSLVTHVQPDLVSDAGVKAVMADIQGTLQKALAAVPDATGTTPVPDNVFDLYEQYAALEVLWERRNKPELPDLATCFKADHSVQELFKLGDDATWRSLKEAGAKKQIRILAPTVPQQAFDPFALRVTTGDVELDGSFFFKFRLRFEWDIKLRSARRWWKPRVAEGVYTELTPETLEPTVVQYARRAGTGAATVRIWYGTSEFIDVDEPATIKIEQSDAKPLVNALERAEFWPLVLAAAVAVITGFATQYSGNNTFGSTKDYLALFLTGTAVDWLKNTVQPTPPAATGTTGSAKTS
jgi:hypothetical protein